MNLLDRIKVIEQQKTIRNILSGLDIGDKHGPVIFKIRSKYISLSATRIEWSKSSVYVLLLADITEQIHF